MRTRGLGERLNPPVTLFPSVFLRGNAQGCSASVPLILLQPRALPNSSPPSRAATPGRLESLQGKKAIHHNSATDLIMIPEGRSETLGRWLHFSVLSFSVEGQDSPWGSDLFPWKHRQKESSRKPSKSTVTRSPGPTPPAHFSNFQQIEVSGFSRIQGESMPQVPVRMGASMSCFS